LKSRRIGILGIQKPSYTESLKIDDFGQDEGMREISASCVKTRKKEDLVQDQGVCWNSTGGVYANTSRIEFQ